MASLLYRSGQRSGDHTPPPYAEDLRLDALVRRLIAGRELYDLTPYFWERLASPDDIQWRHQVFGDLERPELRYPVDAFAEAMRGVREAWARARDGHPLQRQGWQVRALRDYTEAIVALRDGLAAGAPGSPGLREFVAFLDRYVAGTLFTQLRRESAALLEELGLVRYRIQVRGIRVRVTEQRAEDDYGREVERTFARFGDGIGRPTREPESASSPPLTSVEARILEGVASLHGALFGRLAAFCARHQQALDPVIGRFDQEAQFYLAYLDLVRWLRDRGLEFSYPVVSESSRQVRADRTFDLALAAKLAGDRKPVITNDVRLTGAERVLVVTGPNQGGKTTFARAFGQLHHLAAIGCPVPGAESRIPLCDLLFTHFPREEDASLARGKLEDDLARVREILDRASPRSLVVLNELFSSTTLEDAVALNRRVLERLRELGLLCCCVTFLDELSRLGSEVVSMVSTVDPVDAGRRTFRVVRRRADGRAYAQAVAEKYGLSYEQVQARVDR